MANLIRKTCTKLYQNWPRFVKDRTKNILMCFFGSQLMFTCKTWMLSFAR